MKCPSGMKSSLCEGEIRSAGFGSLRSGLCQFIVTRFKDMRSISLPPGGKVAAKPSDEGN